MTNDNDSDTDKVYSDDERYNDTVSVVGTGHQTAYLDSGMITGRLDDWGRDDLEFGVSVSQDGHHIGLRAGTTALHRDRGDGPDLFIACGLTPEKARQIADGLYEAASAAEQSRVDSEEEPQTDSFLRRLIP